MGRRPGFGTVEKLSSGRYRARYRGPDGKRYAAPTTFVTKSEARGWLSLQHAEITRTKWAPPESIPKAVISFAGYSEVWLATRQVAGRPLKDRTREHYRTLLDDHLLPAFGPDALGAITPESVRSWHAGFGSRTPTMRAHCYSLLRTILGNAVTDGLIGANPAHIPGAGTTKRKVVIHPLSAVELVKLTQAMPERYRAMILLASWCALRFGELTALRRGDIDIDMDAGRGVIHIQRGVVRTAQGFVVGAPKSEAGIRDVAVPPHLLGAVQSHLAVHVGHEPDALLFPAHHGGHLAKSTLSRHFDKAREVAGRPDARFHDLRHTGAVLAAATGASLAELMGRLGHSSPAAALRYQHVAAGRDQVIAEELSKARRRGSAGALTLRGRRTWHS